MKTDSSAAAWPTYQNPVYPRSFPDPYILKFRGEYYAVCTDFASDGKVFEMLHSRDLVHWKQLGGAMTPLESGPPLYWAPEITYFNGKFYLYYSTGNEILMEIRVAVSERPDGGFVDAGLKLTSEEFAIDAHVFVDDDGQRYMFYATDFLTHSHIGTGTVVDRMIDPFTLEGNPHPVTRAKFDWQVYDPQRKEKGGVRWHTVEGPFVLKRKDTYYEMFSGGNWQNITYGVSFAASDKIIKENEWTQYSDGEKVLPILRTIPDRIIGPGHNSVVRGPNNLEEYCVYHRWTSHGRVLCIDRMDFTGGKRIYVLGPTDTPQPAPLRPAVLDFFDNLNDEVWTIIAGEWTVEDNRLLSSGSARNETLCRYRTRSFICEFSLSAGGLEEGQYGFILGKEGDVAFRFAIDPGMRRAVTEWSDAGSVQSKLLQLPADFECNAFHLVRLEVDSGRITVTLDEAVLNLKKVIDADIEEIRLFADGRDAAFSGFALTSGFADLFDDPDDPHRGWNVVSGKGSITHSADGLSVTSRDGETALVKKVPSSDFDLTVNLAITELFTENTSVGFGLSTSSVERAPVWELQPTDGKWRLCSHDGDQNFDLPDELSPTSFQQFRFLQIAGETRIYIENDLIGTVAGPENPGFIVLTVRDASVTFDMVRFVTI